MSASGSQDGHPLTLSSSVERPGDQETETQRGKREGAGGVSAKERQRDRDRDRDREREGRGRLTVDGLGEGHLQVHGGERPGQLTRVLQEVTVVEAAGMVNIIIIIIFFFFCFVVLLLLIIIFFFHIIMIHRHHHHHHHHHRSRHRPQTHPLVMPLVFMRTVAGCVTLVR
jgi:hypothetical protein